MTRSYGWNTIPRENLEKSVAKYNRNMKHSTQRSIIRNMKLWKYKYVKKYSEAVKWRKQKIFVYEESKSVQPRETLFLTSEEAKLI